MKTFYVALQRQWSGQGWRTVAETTAERPETDGTTIAVYEVQSPTKSTAVPILLEYLHRGRPSFITARQVYPAPAPAEEREAADD